MKVRLRYAKGRRNEYKSMKLLENEGWMCFRTAGSHSDWDIIALKRGYQPMLVQVKTNKKPIPMDRGGEYSDYWILIHHVWYDRATRPEVFSADIGDRLPGVLGIVDKIKVGKK